MSTARSITVSSPRNDPSSRYYTLSEPLFDDPERYVVFSDVRWPSGEKLQPIVAVIEALQLRGTLLHGDQLATHKADPRPWSQIDPLVIEALCLFKAWKLPEPFEPQPSHTTSCQACGQTVEPDESQADDEHVKVIILPTQYYDMRRKRQLPVG